MFTEKRLDYVYKNAKKIQFDDSARYVFFSDVHRGDNSVGDEFGQNRSIYYHALQYYYEDGFTYVEVGDGDELWETPNYKYIRSSHPDIFASLRKFQDEDRLIMIYGNHNVQLSNPDYIRANMTREFDDYLGYEVEILPGLEVLESVVLQYKKTGQEIFVTHGHQGEVMNDYLWPVTYVLCRYVWRYLHKMGFRYAASPARNKFTHTRVEKKLTKWLEDKDLMLICGHTHRPRLPQPGEICYFNSGCCIHPRGITCIELSYGEIALVNWMVHTRRDGMMYIKRSIVKGPEDISAYQNVKRNDDDKKNEKERKSDDSENK